MFEVMKIIYHEFFLFQAKKTIFNFASNKYV